MLTETVIIFSVLLGLMILISVLGGSVLPLENFADEVVIDEDSAAPQAPVKQAAPAPPAATPETKAAPPAATPEMKAVPEGMSADELKELVEALVALPSDEERMKVMDPMSDDIKQMLLMMLKGMGLDMTAPPAKKEGKPPAPKKPDAPPATEGFMGTMKKVKKEPFTGSCGFNKEPFVDSKKKAVEPFDGDLYALF